MTKAVEESLSASRREGVAAQISAGILDYYLVPFALLIGATTGQVGLLVAFPNLLSALSQFFVVDVLRAVKGRRRMLLWSVVSQAAVLTPLVPLAVVPVPGRLELVFALTCAYRVIGAVMGPPWGSLMSDHLSPLRRGDYFGRRSQLVGLAGLANTGACGAVLYALKSASPALSFALLFSAAALSRAWSFRYMRKMLDLPDHPHVRERFDWAAVRKRLHESNVARFLAYVCAMTFAAQMSAAYLSVHMLRDLRYDYMRYTVVQLASAVAGYAAFPLWGRHADYAGNARVLKLNGLLLPAIPVLWCMTERWWGLAAVEAFGGFLWAGFNLCTTNFLYDSVEPAGRVRALGYYNLINGTAAFLGASSGALLADRLPAIDGYPLHALFLLSACARFAADFGLSRHFHEVREAPHVPRLRLFFSVVGLHPIVGRNLENDWDPPAPAAKRT